MKILHLSDTHNCHHRLRDLPEADVVVHSGDFCMVGTEQEVYGFLFSSDHAEIAGMYYHIGLR